MAEHKECKHYEGCCYRNDIGCCPNWCAQFKHKDDVRVVRCKDCKRWLKDVAGCTEHIGRCEFANYMVGAVGYCVYGERKDNA